MTTLISYTIPTMSPPESVLGTYGTVGMVSSYQASDRVVVIRATDSQLDPVGRRLGLHTKPGASLIPRAGEVIYDGPADGAKMMLRLWRCA